MKDYWPAIFNADYTVYLNFRSRDGGPCMPTIVAIYVCANHCKQARTPLILERQIAGLVSLASMFKLQPQVVLLFLYARGIVYHSSWGIVYHSSWGIIYHSLWGMIYHSSFARRIEIRIYEHVILLSKFGCFKDKLFYIYVLYIIHLVTTAFFDNSI